MDSNGPSGSLDGPRPPLFRAAARFVGDSPVERNGFELPVPRQPPEVVFVSIHVRADFSLRRIKQRRHEPLSNPWWCHAAPMIRIRFPPAPSQKRTMRLPARLARIGRHDLDCRTAILVGTRPKLERVLHADPGSTPARGDLTSDGKHLVGPSGLRALLPVELVPQDGRMPVHLLPCPHNVAQRCMLGRHPPWCEGECVHLLQVVVAGDVLLRHPKLGHRDKRRQRLWPLDGDVLDRDPG